MLAGPSSSSLLCFIFWRTRSGFFLKLHLTAQGNGFNPQQQLFSELFQVLALLAAAAIMAVIERRSILDYNLRDSRRVTFLQRICRGFCRSLPPLWLSRLGSLAALRPGGAQRIRNREIRGDLVRSVSSRWVF